MAPKSSGSWTPTPHYGVAAYLTFQSHQKGESEAPGAAPQERPFVITRGVGTRSCKSAIRGLRARTPTTQSSRDRRAAISMLDSPQVATVSMSWQPGPGDRRAGARSLAMGLAPDSSKGKNSARRSSASEAKSSRLPQYYLDRQDIYSPDRLGELISPGGMELVSDHDEVNGEVVPWLSQAPPSVLSPPFNPTHISKLPSPKSCPGSPHTTHPHEAISDDLEMLELRRSREQPAAIHGAKAERAPMQVATATAHFSTPTASNQGRVNTRGPAGRGESAVRSHSTPPVRNGQATSSAWVLLPERQVLLPPGSRRSPSYQLHQPVSSGMGNVQWMQSRIRAERNGQAFL